MTKVKLVDLNKSNISKQISSRIGFSKLYSDKITDNLIIVLKNLTNEKSNIKIKNFGTFKILLKNERIGRNPKSKKEYKIRSRKSVTFSSSSKITKKLDKL